MHSKSIISALLLVECAAAQFSFSFDDQSDDESIISGGCLSDLLTSQSFVGICNVDWNQVKPVVLPTQADLGFAYIAQK
jgi:hypothetical protein